MAHVVSCAVGWSAADEAAAAGAEAVARALELLDGGDVRLAVAFGSSWFDQQELLEGLRTAIGNVPLVGGSTAGEIAPDGPHTRSCVVLLMASSAVTCSVGAGTRVEDDPRQAGHRVAYTAARHQADTHRMGFLFFADGLATSYTNVVRGMQEVLGNNALIVGALMGDDLRFARTYQYANEQLLSQAVAGVLVSGPGKIGVGIEHGFAPISKPRQITRAHANVLQELDHQPAASVYEEYFGTEAVGRLAREGMLTRQAIAYPLGIQCEAPNRWLLRNVVAFQDDGSLSCNGEILEGSWLQLMIGSRELALDAAETATREAIRSLNRVAGLLVFDSAARRRLLGEHHAAMEIARIRRIVGASVPVAGCYTYGEQGPIGSALVAGQAAVQTGSILVMALGE